MRSTHSIIKGVKTALLEYMLGSTFKYTCQYMYEMKYASMPCWWWRRHTPYRPIQKELRSRLLEMEVGTTKVDRKAIWLVQINIKSYKTTYLVWNWQNGPTLINGSKNCKDNQSQNLKLYKSATYVVCFIVKMVIINIMFVCATRTHLLIMHSSTGSHAVPRNIFMGIK